MASVTISSVRKTYGAVSVIHGVDIDIRHGEFVVLVGPSGCGKSTLLRMIAGLENISAGTIAIDDKVVNHLEPKDRDIAMVFQNYALYPQMTVAQNMSFALELAKVDKATIRQKVDAAAAILGLEPLLDRKPAQLSGGQRQRVAMGRAIVRNPKVFLFDEPLSNLDAKLRVAMRAEIKSLHQRLGTTVVYVTHDQIEAMTMADKIVVLNAGRVEQIGTPLELYDRPVNRFVAGFIGSPAMNFLRGTLQVDQAGLKVASGSVIAIGAYPVELTGRTVEFGIRPEHIQVTETGGLDTLVDVVEPTGSETHVVADVAGEKLVALIRRRMPISVGDRLPIVFEEGQGHLFDAESGQRLILSSGQA
ncbi:sugar ABC transporter ATP-binding protein [Pleomorphomonas diazotrophica]|uniref:Sugar ABC transporter ATP-binding protein n=1 Tax=Pleomorphomonas diazotrophica TaxID=1166257 RepID=A0A1I4QDD8_9HYPH|nr:sn-glycerol-3-phosphate ABC transporter ATP-binding protein UgpC [Pleomorphomonas diazotrophica]PKR90744.1 sugar ABC transporter ATP-binding protein [Pleomorphomonas diazotrophica]SFM38112.1 carbohydrate ABC transporter ATP-binding protein, CUT1 family [Pleomorphomonas diazotrophica]